MTEHSFDIPGVGARKYVIDINPHYTVRTVLDKSNVIDGRWIDTSSGLFIDITAIRADDSRRARGDKGALMCKDTHRYQENDIFPLRRTVFEGVPAKVPYAYTKLLALEYGQRSMTNTQFNGYTFSEAAQLWIKNPYVFFPKVSSGGTDSSAGKLKSWKKNTQHNRNNKKKKKRPKSTTIYSTPMRRHHELHDIIMIRYPTLFSNFGFQARRL